MNINLICIAYRRRKMGFRGFSPLKKKRNNEQIPCVGMRILLTAKISFRQSTMS